MSKNYTQLSLEQRYQIEALLKAGVKRYLIANQIGVHASTISRELKRNIPKRGVGSSVYNALRSEEKTRMRHQIKCKRIVFTEPMKELVKNQLSNEKWSPEIISYEGKKTGKCPVSHETIYKWIWDCKHTNKKNNRKHKTLYRYLKHGKRRRKRGNRKDSRGVISNRVSIEMRPEIVNKRKRLGDIEVDLMMGKNHKSALLVMTDRACLHTRLQLLSGKESKAVARGIIKCLRKNKYPLHTLTFDNDKAFSCHAKIGSKMNVATYFTRPYTSQDKGTVENRIGVIRRFFPKGTDLRFVTQKEVKEVEKKINNRPIRKFNYLTANQMLLKKIALIT